MKTIRSREMKIAGLDCGSDNTKAIQFLSRPLRIWK